MHDEMSTYHLIGQHEDGFKRKLALAVVEQILQTGSEQIDHHDVVVSFHTKPMYIWDTH